MHQQKRQPRICKGHTTQKTGNTNSKRHPHIFKARGNQQHKRQYRHGCEKRVSGKAYQRTHLKCSVRQVRHSNLCKCQVLQHDCNQKHDRQNQKFAQIHGRDADGKHIHLLYGTSLKFHVVDHAGSNHDTEQIQHHNHAVELGQQDIHRGQRQIQKCVFPHNEIDKCVGGSQDTNGQQHGNHAGSLSFPKFDCQRFHNFALCFLSMLSFSTIERNTSSRLSAAKPDCRAY